MILQFDHNTHWIRGPNTNKSPLWLRYERDENLTWHRPELQHAFDSAYQYGRIFVVQVRDVAMHVDRGYQLDKWLRQAYVLHSADAVFATEHSELTLIDGIGFTFDTTHPHRLDGLASLLIVDILKDTHFLKSTTNEPT